MHHERTCFTYVHICGELFDIYRYLYIPVFVYIPVLVYTGTCINRYFYIPILVYTSTCIYQYLSIPVIVYQTPSHPHHPSLFSSPIRETMYPPLHTSFRLLLLLTSYTLNCMTSNFHTRRSFRIILAKCYTINKKNIEVLKEAYTFLVVLHSQGYFQTSRGVKLDN